MLINVLKSKIHRVKVTGADLNYIEGIEFFVKEGTTPTWEELREICGDKPVKK